MEVGDLHGKAVLVTGAARGIGRETALACARRGASLVICDTNETALGQSERAIRELGCEVLARRVDVGCSEEVRALADEVHGCHEALDLLVNNAGVGMGALFLDTSLEDWTWVARNNLFGAIHGCHFFVPAMVKRGRGGHVVNVAAAAAFTPLPAQSGYAATKAAVLGFSEVLRAELAPFGIGVSAACPGFINTGIAMDSRARGIAADPNTRKRSIDFYRKRNYPPERAALRILKGVQRNRAVVPIAPEAWLMYFGGRFLPGLARWTRRKLAARIVDTGGAS